MTTVQAPSPAKAYTPGRRLQLMMGTRHDPYQARRKPRAGTVCPVCSLVFEHGRWQHGAPAHDAHREVCPACHRIRDHDPAGYLTIDGPFAYEHRDDVLRTVHNFAGRMAAEHPLQRIMNVETGEQALVVTTTDIHLAQGIGRALHDAFHGNLEYRFNESQYSLRVYWSC